MIYSDANTEIISLKDWGHKKDPTEYDYVTKTIRIREDYKKQMSRNPLTHHWIHHEFAHHMVANKLGKQYIIDHSANYPDNAIERFAYAYQFYYLMETKSCGTFNDLCNFDPFFRHKKLYQQTLNYYWNNANFIIDEFNKT
jgi:hypothetical protein